MKRQDFDLSHGEEAPATLTPISERVIVFDTETTGLPKNYSASAEDVDNWPRIIQLAWSIYSKQGELLKRRAVLIKPNGWEVPKEEFWVNNGFSQENSLVEGTEIIETLKEYVEDRLNCGYAAAHNMSFDGKIIRAEMIRAGISVEFKAEKICTMKSTIKFCNIPFPSGRAGAKFPNLTELHNKLFNKGFEKAHDAGGDVDACAACLFELVKLNIINF